MTKVFIPEALQGFTKKKSILSIDANTVQECLDNLQLSAPRLSQAITDSKGKLSGYISLYLNGQPILADENNALAPDDKLELIVAVSGG